MKKVGSGCEGTIDSVRPDHNLVSTVKKVGSGCEEHARRCEIYVGVTVSTVKKVGSGCECDRVALEQGLNSG